MTENFDMQKYLIDKLDKIEQRMNDTCQTVTEIKTTQTNFIDTYHAEIDEELRKKEKTFDIKIAVVGLAVAIYSVYGEMFGK